MTDNAPLIEEPYVIIQSGDTDLTRPVGDGGALDQSLTNMADPQALLAALQRAVTILQEPEQNRRRPLIPLWLTKYLLLITVIIQAFAVGMLEVFFAIKDLNNNTSNFANSIVYTGDALMIIIEAVQLFVIVVISFKLVKQVFHHTASGSFLAQSYLSTVLLFAGLYTLFYRFKSEEWENVVPDENDHIHPILIFLRLLYFSVSTATLCGTSSVEPLAWYCYLTVGVQMLLSFCYFASILSLTIVPRKQSTVAPRPRQNQRSCSQKIRNCFARCCRQYE